MYLIPVSPGAKKVVESERQPDIQELYPEDVGHHISLRGRSVTIKLKMSVSKGLASASLLMKLPSSVISLYLRDTCSKMHRL